MRVTVRIWMPHKDGSKSFGHASIETAEEYISFWPKAGGMTLFDTTRPGFHATLQQDFKSYDQGPYIEIEFYSLNGEKIHEGYRELKKQNYKWGLFGSGFFKMEANRNCSGLVFYLLKLAGIDKLIYTDIVN